MPTFQLSAEMVAPKHAQFKWSQHYHVKQLPGASSSVTLVVRADAIEVCKLLQIPNAERILAYWDDKKCRAVLLFAAACEDEGIPLKISEESACALLNLLHHGYYSAGYLDKVWNVFKKLAELKSFFITPFLTQQYELVVQQCRPLSDSKVPVSRDLLTDLIRGARNVLTGYRLLMVQTMFVMAWAGSCRVSEYTIRRYEDDVNHNLLASGVYTTQRGMGFIFESDKTTKGREAIKHRHCNWNLLPEEAIEVVHNYMALRPDQAKYFLCKEDGSQLHYQEVCNYLDLCLIHTQHAKVNITTHSFCMGRASMAQLLGGSYLDIARDGRWTQTSRAMEAYARGGLADLHPDALLKHDDKYRKLWTPARLGFLTRNYVETYGLVSAHPHHKALLKLWPPSRIKALAEEEPPRHYPHKTVEARQEREAKDLAVKLKLLSAEAATEVMQKRIREARASFLRARMSARRLMDTAFTSGPAAKFSRMQRLGPIIIGQKNETAAQTETLPVTSSSSQTSESWHCNGCNCFSAGPVQDEIQEVAAALEPTPSGQAMPTHRSRLPAICLQQLGAKPVVPTYAGSGVLNFNKHREERAHPEAAMYFLHEIYSYPVYQKEKEGPLVNHVEWKQLYPNVQLPRVSVQTQIRIHLVSRLKRRIFRHIREYRTTQAVRRVCMAQAKTNSAIVVPQLPPKKQLNSIDVVLMNFFIDEIHRYGLSGRRGLPPLMFTETPDTTTQDYVQIVMNEYKRKCTDPEYAAYEAKQRFLEGRGPNSLYKRLLKEAGADVDEVKQLRSTYTKAKDLTESERAKRNEYMRRKRVQAKERRSKLTATPEHDSESSLEDMEARVLSELSAAKPPYTGYKRGRVTKKKYADKSKRGKGWIQAQVKQKAAAKKEFRKFQCKFALKPCSVHLIRLTDEFLTAFTEAGAMASSSFSTPPSTPWPSPIAPRKPVPQATDAETRQIAQAAAIDLTLQLDEPNDSPSSPEGADNRSTLGIDIMDDAEMQELILDLDLDKGEPTADEEEVSIVTDAANLSNLHKSMIFEFDLSSNGVTTPEGNTVYTFAIPLQETCDIIGNTTAVQEFTESAPDAAAQPALQAVRGEDVFQADIQKLRAVAGGSDSIVLNDIPDEMHFDFS